MLAATEELKKKRVVVDQLGKKGKKDVVSYLSYSEYYLILNKYHDKIQSLQTSNAFLKSRLNEFQLLVDSIENNTFNSNSNGNKNDPETETETETEAFDDVKQ